ncbi:MAG: zinc ribbon domain-containing protein [Haloferacaceae archaeon]
MDEGIDASCPQCGEPISGREGRCPACGLDFLDDDGGLSQDAIDAMLADADIAPPDAAPGRFVTPPWVRLLVGLAITVPMGPLVMFIAESVAPVSLTLAVVSFVVGWLTSGWLVSRWTVPSAIVAAGLVLVGVTMAVTPLVIVAGRALLGTEADEIGTLGSNVLAAQAAFMLVGLVVLGLGAVVYRHAAIKRASWDEQDTGE